MPYFCIKINELNPAGFSIFLVLFLISCSQDIIFDSTQKVNNPWVHGEPLRYEYEVIDTSIAYDLIITIRHQSAFPFENLYLNTTTIFPDSTSTTYPVSFQLAGNAGEWIGDCSGDACNIAIEMSTAAYYKSAGKYQLVFDQYSRKDSLTGINSVRITVRKSE